MAPKVHCTKKSTMKLTLHSDNYEEHNVPLPYPKSDPTIKLSLHTDNCLMKSTMYHYFSADRQKQIKDQACINSQPAEK